MPKILLFCFWFLWGAGGGLQNQSVTLSCFRANQCKQSKLAVMTFILKEAATSGFLVQLAAAQLGWRKFPVSEDTWFPTPSIYDWQPEREREEACGAEALLIQRENRFFFFAAPPFELQKLQNYSQNPNAAYVFDNLLHDSFATLRCSSSDRLECLI